MKERLKIKCDDKHYKSWTIYTSDTLYELDQTLYTINPIQARLFNQDIFEYDTETHAINILHSSNREMPVLPGILILEHNRTYGIHKQKYLYRFVPDDRRLPDFLVPYKEKQIGFNKRIVNKYAIMKFSSWTPQQKHPHGQMVNVIGPVNDLTNFYEYQLYCKSLYASLQSFTKKTVARLRETSEQTIIETIKQKYKLIDRTSDYTFTIDSSTSKDFDDAFSIQPIENTNLHRISIYIANVTIWLDVMNLWDSFSDRIATIYLPDRKRPMMPTILSDCLCSLVEGNTRFAFTLDMIVNTNGKLISHEFNNTIINVNKNHAYETPELYETPQFKLLLDMTKRMNRTSKSIPKLNDSHHMVSYMMVLMNYVCAKELTTYKNGIFRSVKTNQQIQPNHSLPDNVVTFITMWNSTAGVYVPYEEYDRHDTLSLDAYVHITSPIRRLVDILNLLDLQHNLGLLEYNDGSKQFYDRWTSTKSIEYINTSMRSIRKIQRDCDLLTKYTNNPSLLDKDYDGYVFDKICRNDKLYQCMVYIPEMNMVSKLTTRLDIQDYTRCTFQLFLFKDEANMSQKIKLKLVED